MVTISTGTYSMAQGALVRHDGETATIRVGSRTLTGKLITNPANLPKIIVAISA